MASFWAVKRQVSYFLIFVIVVLAGLYFVWRSVTSPTCFDNKQNQNEEGIDCGGPCSKKCLGEIKEMVVLWSKFFKMPNGKYEVVALVKNPNIILGLRSLKYQFKFYEKNNVKIGSKDGQTFFNPGETFPIIETDIDLGVHAPVSAFITLEENPKWERIDKNRPPLTVSQKQFFNGQPFPRLSAVLENKSLSSISDIDVAAVLYNKDNNAQGVSYTKIDEIKGESSEEAVFTWPQPFAEEPFSIEIFFRTSL
jgi:hypothetical protein